MSALSLIAAYSHQAAANRRGLPAHSTVGNCDSPGLLGRPIEDDNALVCQFAAVKELL
jgi:hypothetical protein